MVDRGANWGADNAAPLQPLPSVGASLHAGPIEYPEPGVIIEYMLNGDVIGRDEIPVPAIAPSGASVSEVTDIVASAILPVRSKTDKLTFDTSNQVASSATVALNTDDKTEIANEVATQINNSSTSGITTLLDRLPEQRAALIDNLAKPVSNPGPVIAIPSPQNTELQVLWGYAKHLGMHWNVGDEVRVTPVGINQSSNGKLVDLSPVTTKIQSDGSFQIFVDKGCNVRVQIGNYYDKEFIVSEHDEQNLTVY